ncbi:hypothetical protein H7E67_14530 [Clostridium gasigenes]|uniref:DUF6625 family protein n=1 Tax=Clostridium gasigenes TaxID=94869 RepID=UPI0016277D96|nr:DUF6625 family protein [Clostridium gasigenes]MBB6624653.1 hypothetical protein [Clostridium gasigenes]
MKIALICPYFGKMPNYFNYVLKSCEFNPDINWIIFTDDREKFNYPKNVKVIYMSFTKFRELIQSKFDFNIRLETPYKLCDYKPVYGFVIEEYLEGFDYWGHCDIDCIFGDLKSFLSEPLIKGYDKICYLGHLTIYKNNSENNQRFKLTYEGKSYKDIFSEDKIYVFDEDLHKLSMNTIYKEHNYDFYKKPIFGDISCLYYDFRLYVYDDNCEYRLEKKSNQIFKWENGKVFSIKYNEGILESNEFGYIHFQKRTMKVDHGDLHSVKEFIIKPNNISSEKINVINILNNQEKKLIYAPFFKQKIKALKYKLSRLIGD